MDKHERALEIAAWEACHNEVVRTEMVPCTIGEGRDFETAEEWVQSCIRLWLDAASADIDILESTDDYGF